MKVVKRKGGSSLLDLREIAHNYKELSTLRDKSNILKMLDFVCSAVERISESADRLILDAAQDPSRIHQLKSSCISVEWTVRIVRGKISHSHTQFSRCIKAIPYSRPKLLRFLSFFNCHLGEDEIRYIIRMVLDSKGYDKQNGPVTQQLMEKYRLNSSIQDCRNVLSDVQTDIEKAREALTEINSFRLEWVSRLECALGGLKKMDTMLNECLFKQDDKFKTELQQSAAECQKRLLKVQELVKLYAECSNNYLSNIESLEDMIVQKKTGRRR